MLNAIVTMASRSRREARQTANSRSGLSEAARTALGEATEGKADGAEILKKVTKAEVEAWSDRGSDRDEHTVSGDTVIDFGKYKAARKTFREAVTEDFEYVKWVKSHTKSTSGLCLRRLLLYIEQREISTERRREDRRKEKQ